MRIFHAAPDDVAIAQLISHPMCIRTASGWIGADSIRGFEELTNVVDSRSVCSARPVSTVLNVLVTAVLRPPRQHWCPWHCSLPSRS